MALIKCPECGKMISDMTDKCTDCGYPIYLMKRTIKKCPFCGGINYGYDSTCKNCGGELELEPEDTKLNSVSQSYRIKHQSEKIQENIRVVTIYGKAVNKYVALLLCIFFGYFGAHKFYEGKILLGVLYFFTGGLCGIGVIIDFITLLFKPNPYYA